MNMKKNIYRFIIVSPRQKNGGSIVLHTLCKQLSLLGYDAKILYTGLQFYKKGRKAKFWIKYIIYRFLNFIKDLNVYIFGENKFLKNPNYIGYVNESVKGCSRKLLPWANSRDIVIYPDVAYGNFTLAKNVVRWFLFHNRFSNDAYQKNDMFWCFREVFNDYTLNPTCRKLHITYFNLDLYKQYNFDKRNGKCYIIRKGIKRADLPSKFDGIIIDDLPEIEKVKVFNECEYCISYDTQTAYSSISALCGCIAIVIPEPGKSKSDYRKKDDKTNYGVAWGFSKEEIEYAISTRSRIKEKFEKTNLEGINNAKLFAEACIDYFNKIV